jgi:hypothetical protein
MGDPKEDKNDRDGAGRRKTRAKGHAVERTKQDRAWECDSDEMKWRMQHVRYYCKGKEQPRLIVAERNNNGWRCKV